MPTPILQLEDLLALADTLRAAGFALGTKQYIAAHELLIALAARGQLPENPTKWRTLLGPIFCSSPREQEEFAEHFAAWLQQRPALQQAVAAAQPTTIRETKSQETVRRYAFRFWLAATWRTFKRPMVWGSAAALIVLASAAASYLNAKTERVLTGKVISEATQQPLAGATVTFLDTKQPTDAQGEFRFSYQIRNYERFQSDKIEGVLVEHPEHELVTRTIVTKSPTRQEITLPKSTKPAPTFTPPPLPPVTEPQPSPPITAQNNRRLWPAAVPLLLYVLWLLWRWWRRRLILQRLPTSGTPRLQELKLAREGVKLFDAPAFRRAVVELRRHRHVEANDLDVAATVRATIRRGGLLTPSFGRRRTLPDYLLLIDRASLHDEQARVGEALAARLKAGEVGIEWFYFQGDARTCRAEEPFAPTITLSELAARFPEHRLLVFGDGAGFFDSFSGEPHRWLEQFAHWSERAVITPAPPDAWGYREETLQEHDFLLLPASADGFDVLAAWLTAGLKTEARHKVAPPFPALVLERPKRWLERLAPQPNVAAELIAQLKDYLDAEGWLWLRACAVYPQVTWELTLYLGARLFGPSLKTDWAERVLQLVRLPWFRYGTMPDWLRAQLIAEFTPEQETQVRSVIADLLQHVLTKPGEAIPLEVATAPEQELHGWQKYSARIQQWWQRRRLYRMLQAQPEDSMLRDYVFLRFLAGQRPNRLTVQAPSWWQRLLFVDGHWAMGLHPITMGVLALLASLALFGMFWVRPMIDDRALPVPDAEISPTPLPTVPTNVPLTQSPTPSPTLTPSPTPPPVRPAAPPQEGIIFDNGNTALVYNNPPRPPQFTLRQAGYITSIWTYHWNDGKGATPGGAKQAGAEGIRLRRSDGTMFGPWPIKTSPGQDKAPDVNWDATPNVTIPAGTYTVVDPDPASWAHNPESGNRGITRIKGYLIADNPQSTTTVDVGNGVKLELVSLPGGDFIMGSGKGLNDEKPPHRVRVSSFLMGKFEVTQAQWQAVMGNNPSDFKGTDLPVENVSWNQAVEFCRRLSQKTGLQFRLPTEAEWEYAARAGTTTEYSFGDDVKQLGAYAWYYENSGSKTHPVGKKLPNRFGLFDMHGNVWEWCQDWYGNYSSADQVNPTGPRSGQYRVLRGGSWYANEAGCRSAYRARNVPGDRGLNIGFRVVVAARTP
jgi:formylglycine-generating enzyme required for sulfatase activity